MGYKTALQHQIVDAAVAVTVDWDIFLWDIPCVMKHQFLLALITGINCTMDVSPPSKRQKQRNLTSVVERMAWTFLGARWRHFPFVYLIDHLCITVIVEYERYNIWWISFPKAYVSQQYFAFAFVVNEIIFNSFNHAIYASSIARHSEPKSINMMWFLMTSFCI